MGNPRRNVGDGAGRNRGRARLAVGADRMGIDPARCLFSLRL